MCIIQKKIAKRGLNSSLSKNRFDATGYKRTEESKVNYSNSKLAEKNPQYRKTPTWAKLTDEQVLYLRTLPRFKKGELKAIADEYGVTPYCISGVRSGTNYKRLISD